MELLELLYVLLGLLVFYAVWKQRELRRAIEDLAYRTSQQHDALERELLELRDRLATASQPSNMAGCETAAEPRMPWSADTPHPVFAEEIADPFLPPASVQPIPASGREPAVNPRVETKTVCDSATSREIATPELTTTPIEAVGTAAKQSSEFQAVAKADEVPVNDLPYSWAAATSPSQPPVSAPPFSAVEKAPAAVHSAAQKPTAEQAEIHLCP